MNKFKTPPLNATMLHQFATQLMFKLSDKQCQNLLLEIKVIDYQMANLIKINTDNILPLNHPFCFNITLLRNDIMTEPLPSKSVLSLAPQSKNGYIVINQVTNHEN